MEEILTFLKITMSLTKNNLKKELGGRGRQKGKAIKHLASPEGEKRGVLPEHRKFFKRKETTSPLTLFGKWDK